MSERMFNDGDHVLIERLKDGFDIPTFRKFLGFSGFIKSAVKEDNHEWCYNVYFPLTYKGDVIQFYESELKLITNDTDE